MTHALNAADEGDTVQVAAGTYQPGSVTGLPTDPGESFPLRIKEGVSLVGEPAGAAQGTLIQGSGAHTSASAGSFQAAMILTEGAAISRLTVRSDGEVGLVAEGVNGEISNVQFTNNETGALLISSNVSISNNTFSGNTIGIQSMLGDSSRIEQNTIQSNTGDPGIGVRILNAGPALRQNQVTGNPGGGVVVDGQSNPDLGGGGRSDGANTLSCNGSADLINNDDSAIFARNNLWDHLDPDGIDAVDNGAGIIDTTGAGIAALPCG
ncbi:MAG: DUF1565 domain-containing protein [Candidatus Manganitrophus sp.]|nr:MAG: DUF1565 domain-containing protein [Candidatus Manganitrophus sp.]